MVKNQFAFKPKSHVELCESLKLVDFARGAKLSGSGFSALHQLGRAAGAGVDPVPARPAHHASTATRKFRRRSWWAKDCMVGVGQFPKFKDQYYGVAEGPGRRKTLGKLYLVPTAETPVANIHREEILAEKQVADLLLRLHAVLSRRSGRGGRRHARHDPRASVRQGGIDQNREAGKRLRRIGKNGGQRGKVLQLLGLHYRVILLCTGDMGFGSAKTYDIEVWAPGQGSYLEVSSCSNCEDFQARRMNLRFKTGAGENKFPHILNGSGTALARLFVALIETHQQADGSVKIPKRHCIRI
jgi:seryl-tRNA synthetase